MPAAPALADLHLALSGELPMIRGLGYLLTADYLTANHGPYTAGTFLTGNPVHGRDAAGFAPIDQFRIMLGLRFDFLTGRDAEALEQ